jgi:hypothetical protein
MAWLGGTPAWWVGWVVGILLPAWTSGQLVAGEWVDRGEASIREHRMTDVQFLVLHADGTIAPQSRVRVQQLRHAFGVGFIRRGPLPANFDPDAEVWRAFNLVSLEPVTAWRRVQPGRASDFETAAIDQALQEAEAWGWRVRWGPLVTADAYGLPEWAVPLRGEALSDAARSYARRVAEAFGHRLWDLDLCAGLLDHRRFTGPMLRLLHAEVAAASPDLPTRLHYGPGWEGTRAFDVVAALDRAVGEQLPVEGFAVGTPFPARHWPQPQIEPGLRRLTRFGRPVVLAGLEVGGPNAVSAAVNTETVLRTAFAEPEVEAVVFRGLTPGEMDDPLAALFDEADQPTGVGLAVDRLFRERWWSDETLTADELGVARGRVFFGTYQVTASLPDGSGVSIPLRIPPTRGETSRIILMPVHDAVAADP